MKPGLLILLLLVPALSNAQGTPYAVWENQTTSTYWFVQLDAATGAKTDISPLPGVNAFVAGSATAFNTDSMQYLFRSLNGTNMHLYTIDATTGAVLYNPVIGGNVVGLSYNCNNHLYYGMRITGNSYDLVSVNPVTGMITSVAPLFGFTAYVAETFSFDPLTQHFNLVVYSGGGYRLRSYHAISGLLVNDNPFPHNVMAHRYSCADSTLYGLWEDGSVYKFEKINTATGTHSTVSSLATVTPGYVAESASMNMNGIYIYRGFNSNNNFALISIDASTGNVINVANTNDNAVGFEEGICCYDITTSAGAPLHAENIHVYPIPFSDRFHISGSARITGIELLSMQGQKMPVTLADAAVGRNTVYAPALCPGMYVLKLDFDDGSVTFRKILRE